MTNDGRSTAHFPSGLDGDGGQGHASEMEAVATIDATTAHYPGVDPTIITQTPP